MSHRRQTVNGLEASCQWSGHAGIFNRNRQDGRVRQPSPSSGESRLALGTRVRIASLHSERSVVASTSMGVTQLGMMHDLLTCSGTGA